jgi:hypothetical protein
MAVQGIHWAEGLKWVIIRWRTSRHILGTCSDDRNDQNFPTGDHSLHSVSSVTARNSESSMTRRSSCEIESSAFEICECKHQLRAAVDVYGGAASGVSRQREGNK